MGAFLFFFFSVCGYQIGGHQAFLAETVETGDKNRDDFDCVQMSLVMTMRFIFCDDWNDACKFSTFSLFGNDVIFPELSLLIFV